MLELKDHITRFLELAGVVTIIAGGLVATVHFFAAIRTGEFDQAYRSYRRNVGRAILLGLELLVAADIIGTVALQPTFRDVGVLAAIVLIRTFLSFSLEIEITGRLPWRRSEPVR
jgi:uncharacterized membrane protein